MMEKSNRRLQYYAELANKRSGREKRRRLDDSDVSSEDDMSMNESVSFHENVAAPGDSDFPSSTAAPGVTAADRPTDSCRTVLIHGSSKGIHCKLH